MSKTTIILVAVAVLVMVASAEPCGLRIGPMATYSVITWEGTDFFPGETLGPRSLTLVDARSYASGGLEAEYGPFLFFRLRAEVAEVRAYTTGGVDVTLFPLGGDIIAEPPVRWRVLPYVYFGGELVPLSFGSSSLADSNTYIVSPGHHLRAGIGGRVVLTPRIDAFAELQVYTDDLFATEPAPDIGGVSQAGYGGVGPAKASAGVLFRLGS
jgi:hypothetical protein